MKEFELTSKTEILPNTDKKIFDFYSDFRNISKLIPPQVSDWEAKEDNCSFTVKGQKVGLSIMNKEPNKLIKITGDQDSPFSFFLWIQLKQTSAYETAVRLVFKSELNMIARMTVKGPLKKGLDQIVEHMKLIPY